MLYFEVLTVEGDQAWGTSVMTADISKLKKTLL